VGVPEEVRVVGFDSEPVIARFFRPLFPTSKPDFVRMGALAVEELVRQMSGVVGHPRTYYYPVPVVWREPRAPVVTTPMAPIERATVPV